jgi:hypothetical protein
MAKVEGLMETAVTWSVNGAAGGRATYGTITATGLYTAPATSPVNNYITIRAVSVSNPSVSGAVTAVVKGPGPSLTGVLPSTTLPQGAATITVNVSGFLPGAVIFLDGVSYSTKVLSSTQVSALIGAWAAGPQA